MYAPHALKTSHKNSPNSYRSYSKQSKTKSAAERFSLSSKYPKRSENRSKIQKHGCCRTADSTGNRSRKRNRKFSVLRARFRHCVSSKKDRGRSPIVAISRVRISLRTYMPLLRIRRQEIVYLQGWWRLGVKMSGSWWNCFFHTNRAKEAGLTRFCSLVMWLFKGLTSPFDLSFRSHPIAGFILHFWLCLFWPSFVSLFGSFLGVWLPDAMENSEGSFKDALLSKPSDLLNNRKNQNKIPTTNIISEALTPTKKSTNQSDTSLKGDTKNTISMDKGKKPMVDTYAEHDKNPTIIEDEDMDMDAYIQHLEKVRSDALKLKDSSLLGRVFGEAIEFTKIRMKLMKDWRFVYGEFQLIPKANQWFEVKFANPIDKKKVWEGRPFHIFGQVLILRNWCSNFDPFSENTSRIDTWVRIPLLPVELCNAEAIKTIVKRHKLGSFVKFDNNNETKLGNKFPRFCINVDMAGKVCGEVLIPDAKKNITKYNVWFEDFPEGCGNCGHPDHGFNQCPLRVNHPKKIQINIIRTASKEECKKKMEDNKAAKVTNEEDWISTDMKAKNTGQGSTIQPSAKPYIGGKGGVKVSFIYNPEPDSEIDLHQTEIAKVNPLQTPIDQGQTSAATALPIPQQQDSTKNDVIMVDDQTPEKTNTTDQLLNIELLLENDDLLDEDDKVMYYFDEDITLEDHFSDAKEDKLPSNVSLQSINTEDGSVIQKLEVLKVITSDKSLSHSSKRMIEDDDLDTASSDLCGGNKKKKIG